jgi:hypothetical protein
MSIAVDFHRNRKITVLAFLFIILFGLMMPISTAHADIGPKPNMSFEFIYETDEPLTITSGIQLQCQDPDCLDASPFDDDGRQLLTCTATRCGSVAFGYAKYHRLVITFSDGITRESNTFGKRNFEAKYKVIVRADDLEVSEKLWGFNPTNIMLFGGFGALFIFTLMIAGLLVILGLFIRNARRGTTSFEDAYGLYSITWIIAIFIGIFGSLVSLTILATIVIEAVVGFLYTLIRKLPRLRFLTMILLANLITQPLLLVALSATEGIVSTPGLTIVLELVIWLVEALILFFTMRDEIKFLDAVGISFLINAISFSTGYLLAI